MKASKSIHTGACVWVCIFVLIVICVGVGKVSVKSVFAISKQENMVRVEFDNSYSKPEEKMQLTWRHRRVIYVDSSATGHNTGVDWGNAYIDLQDALARARIGCGNEIWVAEGIYKPSRSDIGVSFDMVEDVGIYGGFDGTETVRAARDWQNNETVLSGYFDQFNQSSKVVRGIGYLGDAVLDGFRIEQGFIGIYCENTWDPDDLHEPVFANCTITENTDYGMQFYDHADALIDNCIVSNNYDGINVSDNCWPEVENCTIKKNDRKGISGSDSSILLTQNIIESNTSDGIYSYGSVLDIMSCIIENNNENGIKSDGYSTCFVSNNIIRLNNESGIFCSAYSHRSEIYNNWIHHNGEDGINFYDTIYTGDVRNNTVVYNDGYGIACDYGYKPVVSNCIVWGNGSGDIYNCNNVTYSCFDNGSSGAGNINTDPLFAYSEPEQFNYHLSQDSLCIDEGNNNGVVTGEVDIDGDDRDGDGYVDMGADEYTCGDVYNESDFNGDGVVNMKDFAIFSAAYLSHDPDEPGLPDPNDADNWNQLCNLEATGDSTYVIDIEDFEIFVEPWLWTACWYNESIWMMSGSGGGESLLLSESLETQSVPAIPVEKSIEEQLADAEVIFAWLEEVSKEKDFFDYIDKKLWKEFVESIYDWLSELEDMAETELKD
jgi:parallel beta-helix repeat protein